MRERKCVEDGSDPSDDTLVRRALAGDEEAFAALHARWSARLLRFAMKRLADPHDAEDAVQEVFLALLQSLPSYRGDSRFSTWLFGVAFHVVARSRRRTQRTALGPSLADAVAPVDTVAERAEDRLDAVRALRRCAEVLGRSVGPSQRAAFWLTQIECRTAVEVARDLRRPPATIRSDLSRVRAALRAATIDAA